MRSGKMGWLLGAAVLSAVVLAAVPGQTAYAAETQEPESKQSAVLEAPSYQGTGFVLENGEYYYMQDGQWDASFEGVVSADNVASGEWWYVKNGKADFSHYGIEKNQWGSWRIEAGKVNFCFNGFLQNGSDWYFFCGGAVAADETKVVWGTVNGEDAWWYIKNGQVLFTQTVAPNEYGWWYVNNGKVDFSYWGLAENEYGWWRIEGGLVNFGYNGFAQNGAGWWYIRNGAVAFGEENILPGTVNGETAWWYFKDGHVLFTQTVAPNEYGWWYVNNGKVDFSYWGLAENDYGWWRIEGGLVNFGYNGAVSNAAGTWLVENGAVNFSYTGAKTINGENYYFTNGLTYSGWISTDIGDCYYKNGVKMTNCVAGGYKLDANGCSQTRQLVLQIVNAHTNNTMSNDGKIWALWNWLVNNSWTYTRTNEHVYSTWVWYDGWQDDYARQCITNQTGNCFRYAAAFGYMVREATGYEVQVWHGYYGSNRAPHGWITVNIDGTWYVYDPDMYKFASKSSKWYKTPFSQAYGSYLFDGASVNLY